MLEHWLILASEAFPEGPITLALLRDDQPGVPRITVRRSTHDSVSEFTLGRTSILALEPLLDRAIEIIRPEAT